MSERYEADYFYITFTYILFLYHWWYYVVLNKKKLSRQETSHFWFFVRFNDFWMCLVASLHSYLNFRWISLLGYEEQRHNLCRSPYIYFFLSRVLPNLYDPLFVLHYNSLLSYAWLLLLQKTVIQGLHWFRLMGISFVKWMVIWSNSLII